MPANARSHAVLTTESKVTIRGQTTIPAPVREALKLKPGQDSIHYEILLLVIEGRLWLEGINGTSVNTCSDILLKHGCMQAMNLDGGTSAMIWYKGKYIMRSSNPALTAGRTLPNAFVYAGK